MMMLAVCIKFNTKFFSSRLCVSRVMCSSFSVHRFGKFLPGGRKSGLYHSINRPGNSFLANSFCHLKIFLVNKICVKLDWPFYYYPAAGFVFKLCTHSLTHCCAWPAEGRSVLHIERSWPAIQAAPISPWTTRRALPVSSGRSAGVGFYWQLKCLRSSVFR